MLALGTREGRKPRRVVAKIECHPRELSPRVGFIVTIRTPHNERVLAFYNDPGTANVRGSMSPHGTTATFGRKRFYVRTPPDNRPPDRAADRSSRIDRTGRSDHLVTALKDASSVNYGVA